MKRNVRALLILVSDCPLLAPRTASSCRGNSTEPKLVLIARIRMAKFSDLESEPYEK